MKRRLLQILVLPALLLTAVACGGPDGAGSAGDGDRAADRTVEIEMRDFAFSPPSLDVRVGETVRFVFTNTGQVVHDALIGDEAAQVAHEKEMADGGHGVHSGGDAKAVSVKPGKQATLTHTFDRPGQVLLGCHQPGHYTGGMRIAVSVA